jgi:CBS domain-containing protein
MASAVHGDEVRYAGPSFDAARVHDAMRIGVVTCRSRTPLRDVARMMHSYGIHSVVVEADDGSGLPLGIVSAIDIATADAPELHEKTAGEVASTDLITVRADESLREAARLMSQHGVTHLVALQPDTQRPVGVISASGLVAAVSSSIG